MEKNKRQRREILTSLAALHILIVILGICVLRTHFIRSKDNIYDIFTKNTIGSVQDISIKMQQYLHERESAAYSYADYIENAGLDLTESLYYLSNMRNDHGKFVLFQRDTYVGYIIGSDSEHMFSYEGRDFSGEEIVREICGAVYGPQEKRQEFAALRVLPYKGGRNGERVITFLVPVRIQSEAFLLCYMIDTDILKEYTLTTQTLTRSNGILLDGEGNILSGRFMDAPPEEQKNFYTYVQNQYGEKEKEKIEALFAEKPEGYIQMQDAYGTKWFCVYTTFENLKGWRYLQQQELTLIESLSDSMNVAIKIAVLASTWLAANMAAVYWYNRKLRGSLAMIEEKNEQLTEANQAKSNFISNMSHEIRTPINAVLGMDEMILRESGDETIRGYAYDIRNAGKMLLGLVNDILDYSKIESGKLEIIPVEYEIASVINDVLNMEEIKIEEKKLELQIHVNEQIPSLLYGDEIRFKQILLNIMSNAVKYTEKGSICFKMDYEELSEDEIELFVSVSDTGIGMKSEEMDRLFQAFERLDEKRNRTIEGTGLGMSIVSSLLEQMGSRLEVESVYGEGSVFSFRLRQKVVGREPVGDIARLRKERRRKNDSWKSVLKASGGRILAVDDTPVNLSVVSGLLKRTGLQIDTAQSGRECLDMAMRKKYHVILLDHRMPEMDGVETLHHLRETDGPNRETPVIALTANAMSGADEMYRKEGFTDFLAKPVDGNKLERMLRQYLPSECLDDEEELAVRIDCKAGIAACGSKELYEQIAGEFTASSSRGIKELRDLYEAHDLENYTIKVHALKSSARLVGAMQLSQEALALEQSGDAGDWNAVCAGTEALLKHYEAVARKLKSAEETEGDAEKPQLSGQELREALCAIGEFNQAFDFDSVDQVMKMLDSYCLPDMDVADYEELKNAVYEVDQPKIQELILKYTGGAEK